MARTVKDVSFDDMFDSTFNMNRSRTAVENRAKTSYREQGRVPASKTATVQLQDWEFGSADPTGAGKKNPPPQAAKKPAGLKQPTGSGKSIDEASEAHMQHLKPAYTYSPGSSRSGPAAALALFQSEGF